MSDGDGAPSVNAAIEAVSDKIRRLEADLFTLRRQDPTDPAIERSSAQIAALVKERAKLMARRDDQEEDSVAPAPPSSGGRFERIAAALTSAMGVFIILACVAAGTLTGLPANRVAVSPVPSPVTLIHVPPPTTVHTASDGGVYRNPDRSVHDIAGSPHLLSTQCLNDANLTCTLTFSVPPETWQKRQGAGAFAIGLLFDNGAQAATISFPAGGAAPQAVPDGGGQVSATVSAGVVQLTDDRKATTYAVEVITQATAAAPQVRSDIGLSIDNKTTLTIDVAAADSEVAAIAPAAAASGNGGGVVGGIVAGLLGVVVVSLLALVPGSRIRRSAPSTVRAGILVGAAALAVAIVVVLLPQRAGDAVATSRLTPHNGQECSKCPARERIEAAGLVRDGDSYAATVLLAEAPSGDTLTLGVAGKNSIITLTQTGSSPGIWTATTLVPHDIAVRRVGVSVDGRRVLITFPADGLDNAHVILGTGSGDLLPSDGTVGVVAPVAQGVTAADVLIGLAILGALAWGYRRRLREELTTAAATVVVLGLALAVYRPVSSRLAESMTSGTAAGALAYGVLIVGITAVMAVVARWRRRRNASATVAAGRVARAAAALVAALRVGLAAAMVVSVMSVLAPASLLADSIAASRSAHALADRWARAVPATVSVPVAAPAGDTPPVDPFAVAASQCTTLQSTTLLPEHLSVSGLESGPAQNGSATQDAISVDTKASVATLQHVKSFSVTVILVDPGKQQGTGPAPIDQLGNTQLWLWNDGAGSYFKAVRQWDGTHWQWRKGSAASDLTAGVTVEGHYLFFWTGQKTTQFMAAFVAADNGCANYGLTTGGEPVFPVR